MHRLTVNAEDVENIFDNLKMEVVCDNPHLLNVWKQSIVETKIQVITIPAIVELYGVLKELKKEESQYKIQLRLLANYSWGFDFIKKN